MLNSLKILFFETLKNYPKLFVILVLALILETLILISSVITIIPLADFLFDPSLKNPNQFTLITMKFLDFLGIEKNYFSFGFLFVITNILRSVFGIFLIKVILTIKYEITKSLRLSLLNDIFSAKWNFFYDLGYGKLLNTLDEVLQKVSDILKHLAGVIPTSLQIIILLIIPFMINFKLTLITLFIAILIIIPFRFFNKYSHHLGKSETKALNNLLSSLNETIQSAKIILGYGNKEKTLKKIEKNTNEFNEIVIKRDVINELTDFLFKPLAILGIIISVGFSISPTSNLSEMAGVFWSLYSAMPLIAKLIKMSLAVNNFLPYYDQLISLRNRAKINVEKKGSKKFNSLNKGISLKNISFSYNLRNQILENVNINIKKNNITSIVGKSGIGKSTLVDLVLMLNNPSEGSIFIDDENANNLDLVSYRKKIGYVPQDPILFNDTIKNNLLWSNESATIEEIETALKKSNAFNFINLLPKKLNTLVGEKGSELSGGERQRIALARALVRKPEILLLDEATSSIDKESEDVIKESLKELSKSTTILIIAHKSNLIKASNYVYLIQNKKINEEGTVENLINNKNSEFYSLYS